MDTLFDPSVPTMLKKSQQWFASIITRPIQSNSKMLPTSPSGRPMKYEAKDYILPSPTLKPHERIEIYNQQFWWRMLSNMHEVFPLVTRLFGYYNFNQQIAIPYLVKYPLNHWSLNFLGSHLAQWVEEEYQGEDKNLVRDAASVDWAFNASFVSRQMPPIDTSTVPQGDISSLLSKTLFLQPHLYLFKFRYDLFSFRDIFNKQDGDYWVDNDFPILPKEKDHYFFVIYRTRKNLSAWTEISAGEYHLLTQFQKGSSIEEACDSLENMDDAIAQDAAINIHKWFQEWIVRGWLTQG